MATASNQLAVYGLILGGSVLSASTSSQRVFQSSTANFAVTVDAVYDIDNPINLSVSGLPSNTTASFSPPSFYGSGTSTVSIDTTAATPTGTYNLTINSTKGNETRTTNVALVVTTLDATPPQAACCTYITSGSSYVLHLTGQDTESGMQSIVPVQLVNAIANVPWFPVGTTNVIDFTVTESSWTSYAKFQLTDVAGNKTYINPVTVDASRQPGTSVPIEIKNITPDEFVLTILNGPKGAPGLRNVQIDIADSSIPKHIQVTNLKDGETRIMDLSSYLPANPYGTTVSITPLGNPSGIGTFVFASANVHVTIQ